MTETGRPKNSKGGENDWVYHPVELLPDGAIVTATYGLKMEELNAKAKTKP